MEKHYLEFDDSEENKLSYTPIFNEYVSNLGLFYRFMSAVEMEMLNSHSWKSAFSDRDPRKAPRTAADRANPWFQHGRFHSFS